MGDVTERARGAGGRGQPAQRGGGREGRQHGLAPDARRQGRGALHERHGLRRRALGHLPPAARRELEARFDPPPADPRAERRRGRRARGRRPGAPGRGGRGVPRLAADPRPTSSRRTRRGRRSRPRRSPRRSPRTATRAASRPSSTSCRRGKTPSQPTSRASRPTPIWAMPARPFASTAAHHQGEAMNRFRLVARGRSRSPCVAPRARTDRPPRRAPRRPPRSTSDRDRHRAVRSESASIDRRALLQRADRPRRQRRGPRREDLRRARRSRAARGRSWRSSTRAPRRSRAPRPRPTSTSATEQLKNREAPNASATGLLAKGAITPAGVRPADHELPDAGRERGGRASARRRRRADGRRRDDPRAVRRRRRRALRARRRLRARRHARRHARSWTTRSASSSPSPSPTSAACTRGSRSPSRPCRVPDRVFTGDRELHGRRDPRGHARPRRRGRGRQPRPALLPGHVRDRAARRGRGRSSAGRARDGARSPPTRTRASSPWSTGTSRSAWCSSGPKVGDLVAIADGVTKGRAGRRLPAARRRRRRADRIGETR